MSQPQHFPKPNQTAGQQKLMSRTRTQHEQLATRTSVHLRKVLVSACQKLKIRIRLPPFTRLIHAYLVL